MLPNRCKVQPVDLGRPQSGLFIGVDDGAAWLAVLGAGRGMKLVGLTSVQARDMARNMELLADELDDLDDEDERLEPPMRTIGNA